MSLSSKATTSCVPRASSTVPCTNQSLGSALAEGGGWGPVELDDCSGRARVIRTMVFALNRVDRSMRRVNTTHEASRGAEAHAEKSHKSSVNNLSSSAEKLAIAFGPLPAPPASTVFAERPSIFMSWISSARVESVSHVPTARHSVLPSSSRCAGVPCRARFDR